MEAAIINTNVLTEVTRTRSSVDNTLKSASASGRCTPVVATDGTCPLGTVRRQPPFKTRARSATPEEPVRIVSVRRNDPYAFDVIGTPSVPEDSFVYCDFCSMGATYFDPELNTLSVPSFARQHTVEDLASVTDNGSVGYPSTTPEVTPTKRRSPRSLNPSPTAVVVPSFDFAAAPPTPNLSRNNSTIKTQQQTKAKQKQAPNSPSTALPREESEAPVDVPAKPKKKKNKKSKQQSDLGDASAVTPCTSLPSSPTVANGAKMSLPFSIASLSSMRTSAPVTPTISGGSPLPSSPVPGTTSPTNGTGKITRMYCNGRPVPVRTA